MREPTPFWQSVIWCILAIMVVFTSQLPIFSGAKVWADYLASIIVGMVLANHTPTAMRKVIESMKPQPPKDTDPQ